MPYGCASDTWVTSADVPYSDVYSFELSNKTAVSVLKSALSLYNPIVFRSAFSLYPPDTVLRGLGNVRYTVIWSAAVRYLIYLARES